jgi:hypothetical protein
MAASDPTAADGRQAADPSCSQGLHVAGSGVSAERARQASAEESKLPVAEGFKASRTKPDDCQQQACNKHAAAEDDAWGSRLALNLAAAVIGASISNLIRLL